MICRSCKLPIHKHQAQRPATVAVHQGGARRVHAVCGECLERIEATMGRRPRAEVQTTEPVGATS